MVRSDFDPLVNEDEISFPTVSTLSSHARVSSDDFEDSVHDRMTAPPIYNSHAKALGVNGLILGFTTAVIGGLQIFGFPILCESGPGTISFSLDYFFGFTLWCGAVLTVNSATGIRTTVTKRQSTVNRFLAGHVITTLLYLIGCIIMIVSFTRGSLTDLDSCMITGHALSAAFICIGMLLQAFTMCFTYETIFAGKTITLAGCCIESIIAKCCPKTDNCIQLDVHRRSDQQESSQQDIEY